MSTLSLDPTVTSDETTVATSRHRDAPGVTAVGVLRSEWLKLRSVRSSATTLAAAAAALVAFGLLFSAVLGGLLTGDGDGGPGLTDSTSATLAGATLAQLIIAVLGVMVITSEYSTGSIRATLTAVPSRLPVLWAKVAVLTATVLPVMLLSTFAVFLGGQALMSGGDVATASLGDDGVLRAVVGTAVYLTGVALIGLAVGTLLRSTAAAISTVFGVLFLLPGLAGLVLPSGWGDTLLSYLPSNAGTSFTSVVASPDLLSIEAGMAVYAAWVVVPLVAAAVALRRRPA